jgi:hypothetical protein
VNLFQELTYRPLAVSRAFGRITTALCQGRCCGNRTAPVFLTFGVRGARLLCADCRAWHERIIRQMLPEIRRAG